MSFVVKCPLYLSFLFSRAFFFFLPHLPSYLAKKKGNASDIYLLNPGQRYSGTTHIIVVTVLLRTPVHLSPKPSNSSFLFPIRSSIDLASSTLSKLFYTSLPTKKKEHFNNLFIIHPQLLACLLANPALISPYTPISTPLSKLDRFNRKHVHQTCRRCRVLHALLRLCSIRLQLNIYDRPFPSYYT